MRNPVAANTMSSNVGKYVKVNEREKYKYVRELLKFLQSYISQIHLLLSVIVSWELCYSITTSLLQFLIHNFAS